MVTQLDLAREALAQIGTRSKIVSLDDGSAEATYINLLYMPIRNFLLTEGDYDWAMAPMTLIEAPGPAGPWNFRYFYPEGALRIRQVMPVAFNAINPNPVEWTVLGGLESRILFTSEEATFAFATFAAPEAQWDGIFSQSFVRMLASALAFALENRIEASKLKMEEALGFAGIGKMRDI